MASSGKVALVTGGSRGIGKGTAIALAKEGARVYITGRHRGGARIDGNIGGLDATAEEVNAAAKAGGSCVAVVCDHSDDASVQKLVDGIFAAEGKLDILVNNAYAGLDAEENVISPKSFWEKPVEDWDKSHNVGLRCHYVATSFCARHWVPAKQTALVANISSAGGFGFVFDVAYGVGKAALDRLTADMGKQLKPHGIAVVSLWPGAVATESVISNMEAGEKGSMGQAGVSAAFTDRESVQFTGRGIVALADDPDVMRLSGSVLMTPEIADLYGFKDIDGSLPWGTFLKDMRKGMAFPPRHWRPPTAPKQAARL